MVERLDRQKQILIKMLEDDRKFKAEEFKVSNQNEPLKFLEKKGLITRDWNNEATQDFKWNYFTGDQKEKARRFLGKQVLAHESKEG